jgi:dephospho-CoA kinase
MKVAGITGGIGSGKSTVAGMLRELGAYVIDADQLARRIVEPGKPAWREIKAFFGDRVFNPDQTINRKKLAETVFANPEARKKLESFTHPRIGEEILKELAKAREQNYPLAVIDAALLIESDAADWLRPLILVVADEESRVQRVCARDSCCAEDVRARIRNQTSDAERRKKADFVIENNCGEKELRARVAELFQSLVSGASGISGNSKL